MKRLLLVGWDAADWKIIDPLLARGEMPHLAGVISSGARGAISTLYPPLSPMLWTSIATGKRAYKHGIHGFTEPTEDALAVRPIGNLSRKTKAFWNVLNQNGKRSVVVGWWPSHPAEPIRGAMVSDRFPPPTSENPGRPMAPGTVWPPELAAQLADLRVHASEITADMLRLFVPEYEKVNQKEDRSLHDLAGIIAETMSIHAPATELMETQEWDLAAIYYVGIDHFSHRFMRYHAGKSKEKSSEEESDPAWFADVVPNAYRYHDVMLGRLLALAGPECAVMLMSDHGFHSGRLLPDYISPEAAGPAAEHRHFGVFCLRAPGVPAGRQVYGATVLDIAPTVLHLFGLPAGADMDGKTLVNAFENPAVLPRIPSWDDVPGDDGRHAASRQYDGDSAAEALQQLVHLGYVAPLEDDMRKAVNQTVAENRYNLARAYLDAGLWDKAAEILEALIADDQEQGRYHLHLFEARFQQRNFAAARRVLDAFDGASSVFAPTAAEELQRRRGERSDDSLQLSGHARPDAGEARIRRELAQKASGFALERTIARARLQVAKANSREGKPEARELLERLEPVVKGHLDLEMFLATGFATLRDYPRALEWTRRVRRADPDHWLAMALEARIHQAANRHGEAVECALESLALVYFQPLLHYHMGISLRRLNEEKRAEHSFRVALSQMPGLLAAHLELAKIMRRSPARLAESAMHSAQAEVLRQEAKRRKQARMKTTDTVAAASKPASPAISRRWDGEPPANRVSTVTVVSGLPRSGTSMMMQMLQAAGIEPYADESRLGDEDNPRGYLEHQRATRLHTDAAWLPEARGKAVKVVAQLLPRLPPGEHYRIVFLQRKLEEVIASQRAMLTRLGRTGANLSEEALARTYTAQLLRVEEWLKRAPGVRLLTVAYSEALDDPLGTAAQLAAFLGEPFDCARASAAVERGLRRQGAI